MERANRQLINRLKLGLILKAVRESRNQTQRDAALGAGYSNATFVCNVEKGGTNLPLDKVMDFAREYGKEQRLDFALAIIRLVHPDAWDASAPAFAHAFETSTTIKQVEKKVDKWIASKLQEYNIEL